MTEEHSFYRNLGIVLNGLCRVDKKLEFTGVYETITVHTNPRNSANTKERLKKLHLLHSEKLAENAEYQDAYDELMSSENFSLTDEEYTIGGYKSIITLYSMQGVRGDGFISKSN